MNSPIQSLPRTLEPEVMDTSTEARDYNEMDHREVNRRFVDDLLATGFDLEEVEILDLGTGTALIPIELCQRHDSCHVMAADLSIAMLELGRYNIEAAGLIQRVQLDHIDAKQLHYPDERFSVVMSNSIVHHIPEPLLAFREALRVLAPSGLVFFRDLPRPATANEVDHLVKTYTGNENANSQKMFRESLHAALTLAEIQGIVKGLGFNPESVRMTSDRHWTWIGRK